ncbi:MAG: hypothetical protein ABIF71_13820 [Planctomycetota bacterium]
MLVLVLAASAGAKHDDIQFAISLNDAGYTWMALQELERMEQDGTVNEKALSLLVRGRIFEKQGDLRRRDQSFEAFLKAAAGSNDLLVKAEAEKIQGRTWDNKEQTLVKLANDIDNLLGDAGKDTARIKQLQSDARRTGDEILRYRRGITKGFDARQVKDGQLTEPEQVESDRAEFALAQTLYYFSFAFKGDDEKTRKELLKEAKDSLSTLAFLYEGQVILISFFAGMVGWETEDYNDAGLQFQKCIDFEASPENRDVRRESYFRGTEAYYKIKRYKDCAETAFYYVARAKVEFTGAGDRTDMRSQTIRLNLAQSLYFMEPADYEGIKTLFNFAGTREEEAIKIVIQIEAENGPRSKDARQRLAEWARGPVKYIAEGVEAFLRKEYDKAITALQKGLKEMPARLTVEERMSVVAKAWYYLGFAYYHQGMRLPAIICFKEGTTRFMQDFRERGERLSTEQKQWFLHNRDNWRSVASMYYRDTRSDLALDVFKEALIAYGQISTGEEEEGGKNMNFLLGVILEQNEEYAEASIEFQKVPKTDPDYLRTRLHIAQCQWQKFIKDGEKDKRLADEAFKVFDEVEKAFKDQLAAATDAADKVEIELQLANLYGRKIPMLYKVEKYQQIIDDIDRFWQQPPKSKVTRALALRYQIMAPIKIGTGDDDAGLNRKVAHLLKGRALLETLKQEAPEDEYIVKLMKNLGYTFFNYAVKGRGQEATAAAATQAMDAAGALLFDFVENAKDVEDAVLRDAADILYDRVQDYVRSEKVTQKLLARYAPLVDGKYPPNDEATLKALDEIKVKMFDRAETRAVWEKFVDRMYDGKGKDGTLHDYVYFSGIKQEYWEEKPCNYEYALVQFSEAVMAELGLGPDARAKRAALRDSAKSDDERGFWTDLFKEFKTATNKDPQPLVDMVTFLKNRITVNNFKERLAKCCRNNNKPQEALAILEELDRYYIFLPDPKWALADVYLDLAKATGNADEKTSQAMKAKDLCVWIETYAPPTDEGMLDYWKAVMAGADVWGFLEKYKFAVDKLEQAVKYGRFEFPNEEIKKRFYALLEKYKKLLESAGGVKP